MMTTAKNNLAKLCHARVGQKVRLPDAATGEILSEVFVVVAIEDPRRRPARANMPHGLYDEGRELLLVSLDTGLARKLPHLSSKADLIRATDLLESMSPVPALVPASAESVVQVQFSTARGTKWTPGVDLSDASAVRNLLLLLQATEGRVLSIETPNSAIHEKLKTQWRQAVAEGETLLSFDDYIKANA